MPTWARLPKTSKTKSLGDRMSSALENGYGDEGPLAKFLGIGGCLSFVLVIFVGVLGIFGAAGYGIWLLVGLVF